MFCLEVSHSQMASSPPFRHLKSRPLGNKKLAVVTSSAEMKVKVKTSPTELLDKTFWSPRPEIGLLARVASRAVSGEANSFRLFLGHQN